MARIPRFVSIASLLMFLGGCTVERKAPEEILPPAEGTGQSVDIVPRTETPVRTEPSTGTTER